MTTSESSVSYAWDIASLERHTSDGIVYTVHWTVSANESDISASAYGSVGLEAPAEDYDVIPYDDLTKETVIEWVKDRLGEDAVQRAEEALLLQIQEKLNPSSASGTPW